MNIVQLKAQKRELSSKGYLNQLRRDGMVPAALSTRGDDSILLTVNSKDLHQVLTTSAGMNVLINLEVGKKEPQLSMIEDLQRDVSKVGVFIHVNFEPVSMDRKMEVDVPVILEGQDKRIGDGGYVSQLLNELTVESTPTSIPESIPVDISNLTIGDSIHVSDITLPEGSIMISDMEDTVVTVLAPTIEEEEEETESVETEENEEEMEEPEIVE